VFTVVGLVGLLTGAGWEYVVCHQVCPKVFRA
jgi:hypothetical protein